MISFARSKDERLAAFDFIKLRIASPEDIRGWSRGEVVKPETINYRSYRPEPDGLFCQRIFGPEKDWECACGKYKRIRFRGMVCDKCGVEVTQAKVRRERMGHIELAVPICHIWFFKTLPSQIGYLLQPDPESDQRKPEVLRAVRRLNTLKNLEVLINYGTFVVTNPGKGYKRDAEVRPGVVTKIPVMYMDLVTEDEEYDLRVQATDRGDDDFKTETGAEAVRTLLRQLDSPEMSMSDRNHDGRGLDRLSRWLRHEIATESSEHRKRRKLKRLEIVDGFRSSGSTPEKRNKPEWMVLEAIPVLPPGIRPLVPLDGGRFATSDMNDLYRRVINRNNRLKKLMDLGAPDVILRNEKRMLQESVDALFDNGRKAKSIRGRGKRPLKSLADNLKGKQGRFRQNLLGKRVDYSGRSVIVVGPELQLHQCGLPKAMAVELFRPFIIHELEKRGEAETVKQAKKLVDDEDPKVYEVLEDIIRDHPVLLNRAPTLHRLGIQAFEPVLVEGKAIRIHPLVCAAFNADFDGDAMAVHVPLSFEAQMEARVLMLSSNNLLLPSNGRPVVAPTQDVVIGCYYLTKAPFDIAALEQRLNHANTPDDVRAEAKNKLAKRYERAPRFSSYGEVETALDHGRDSLNFHTPCWFWPRDQAGEAHGEPSSWIPTTVGRVLFNSIIPGPVGFLNKTFDKGELATLVFKCFTDAGLARTARFLDHLKDFGFRCATMGGITVGVDDLVVPPEKPEMARDANDEATRFRRAYDEGIISRGERYNKTIDVWTHATNDVADVMARHLERSKGGFNPVFMMMSSGARGNLDQMRQLAGMRGLMAKPGRKQKGGHVEIVETPIVSNFREGLTVGEYFLSTHGARKGLTDTALKTADAGYLTRRLVDVAQDVTVTERDCGTIFSLEMRALKEGEDVIEPLADRIVGAVVAEDVFDPATGELLLERNAMVEDEAAQAIENAGIQRVRIRSVLTCESGRGVCQMCYGRNLATMALVDIGEAVGILAAQSIGEPGTQLTLRTFHFGGFGGFGGTSKAKQNQRKSKIGGVVGLERVSAVEDRNEQRIVTSREGEIVVKTSADDDAQVRSKLSVPYGASIAVEEGQVIQAGDLLFSWDPYSEPIVADVAGVAHFSDIVPERTVLEELDETTGRRQRTIIEDRDKKLHPAVRIRTGRSPGSDLLRELIVPVGAQLRCDDGQAVRPGDQVARIARDVYKVHDITGGLPRVAELFEARKPKDPAVVTEIDGEVSFGDIKQGKREVFVTPQGSGDLKTYKIPVGKHLRVHQGDQVCAGDRLSDGSINPHDILQIKGRRKVQEYLLNEIQEVYRLQGVKINDKHIAVIVRQMLQKVEVADPGETELLQGEKVDHNVFRRINEKAAAEGRKAARSKPLLLGVTKTSLHTESFISAASFQETTRVLTGAAVRGATDDLSGLKENIVIGHVIPAGTGVHRWHDVEFEVEHEFYQDEVLPLTGFDQLAPGPSPIGEDLMESLAAGRLADGEAEGVAAEDGAEGGDAAGDGAVRDGASGGAEEAPPAMEDAVVQGTVS